MTTPITTQGPGTQTMHQTPFPPPFGLEQQLGPQIYGQQQMVSQLLPIAYQVILPQVVATATQQIQQYVQYLVSSQSGGQSGGNLQWGPQSGFGQNPARPWGF